MKICTSKIDYNLFYKTCALLFYESNNFFLQTNMKQDLTFLIVELGVMVKQ